MHSLATQFLFITISRSVLLQLCRCQPLSFFLEDRNAENVSKLSTDTEVSGAYRYPCYVSVVVYKNPTRKETYNNATVYAVTTQRTDINKYFGYSSERTDSNGHACVLTLCRERAVLLVESGDVSLRNVERLFAVQKANQSLPVGFTYNLSVRSEEITFNVRNWGVVFGKSGPVYNLEEKEKCQNAGIDNFHFSFSFISVPETFVTAIDINTHYKTRSWYYVEDFVDTYRVCFLKIKIKISSYQANVSLASYDSGTGDWCGTFSAGPKASPSSLEQETKAACMEFRCAVNDKDNKALNTRVVGHVNDECEIHFNSDVKKEDVWNNQTHFSADIHVNNNYGSLEGIYKDKEKEVAKSMCYTGENNIIEDFEQKINPDYNYFVSYDCTKKPQIPVG